MEIRMVQKHREQRTEQALMEILNVRVKIMHCQHRRRQTLCNHRVAVKLNGIL